MANNSTLNISQTVGTNDSISQAFTNEIDVSITPNQSSPFLFLVPVFDINGATYKFYEQTVDGISTNLNNQKLITINFTGNTGSLSGNSNVVHNIYRIPYEEWDDFVENPTDVTKKNQVVSRITEPFFSYGLAATYVAASLNSTSGYTLQLPQKVKKENSYIEDLLIDKAQYFIDINFEFEKRNNLTWGDIQIPINGSGITVIPYYTGSSSSLLSSPRLHLITGGTMSGQPVYGALFTYFIVPQAPNLYVSEGRRKPSVNGVMQTFTPIFNFNNVGDGNRYKLQVTYDVTNYDFDQSREFVEFDVPHQPGDTEFIRTYSTPLTPKKNFLYRIGNVKEIENIFGTRQYVENYCDYLSATTGSDNAFTLSGHTYKNYKNDGSYDSITSAYTGHTYMSGVDISLYVEVNKSKIYLGADNKSSTDILSRVTQPLGGGVGYLNSVVSDVNGFYDFGSLQAGVYTLNINPPSDMPIGLYPNQSLTVNLTRDTNFDIILSILWGNQFYDFTLTETFL